MREDIHLGRVAGVRVGANWSLLVVFWLIAWGLAGTELPDAARGYPAGAYWAAGLAVALVFYACLLAHELAHALVARRHHIGTDGIVLWLLGGVSKLQAEPSDARTELEAGASERVSLVLNRSDLAFFDSAANSSNPKPISAKPKARPARAAAVVARSLSPW